MSRTRAILRSVLFSAALAFLAAGALRTHKVYDEHSDFGVRVFDRVSEVQLVEYATFSGVYVHGGLLIRQEWATRLEGKQPCPT